MVSRRTFILSGAEDLGAVSTPREGVTRYRPRTEGLFARIEHVQTDGANHWEVRSKDGLISYYGSLDPEINLNSRLTDPADKSKIFGWKLTRTEDPFGNHILYEYLRDAGEEGPRQWDHLYLHKIHYIDYDADELTKYLVTVEFFYEDRPDPFSGYKSGFE